MSGHWIMAIPNIREAQASTLQNPTRPAEVRFRNRVDWSKGGVYSEAELKSLRDYMEFSRYKEVLGYQLTRQLRGGSVDVSHEISSQQLFSSVWSGVRGSRILTASACSGIPEVIRFPEELNVAKRND